MNIATSLRSWWYTPPSPLNDTCFGCSQPFLNDRVACHVGCGSGHAVDFCCLKKIFPNSTCPLCRQELVITNITLLSSLSQIKGNDELSIQQNRQQDKCCICFEHFVFINVLKDTNNREHLYHSNCVEKAKQTHPELMLVENSKITPDLVERFRGDFEETFLNNSTPARLNYLRKLREITFVIGVVLCIIACLGVFTIAVSTALEMRLIVLFLDLSASGFLIFHDILDRKIIKLEEEMLSRESGPDQ